MTTSLNSPTVVKSTPQPIDPIPGPKPILATAIARRFREKIRLITAPELTIGPVLDLPPVGTPGLAAIRSANQCIRSGNL
jgi:hypothetical protein